MASLNSALGATLEDDATLVRVRSVSAQDVWLCLFASEDGPEVARLPLERGGADVWEVRVEELTAGQVYGLRARGPWDPGRGQLFDPAKLLVDPYARSVVGPDSWSPELATHGYGRESGHVAPRSVLVDEHFDWGTDRSPRVPWAETVIYEAHVRGLTRLHPDLPASLRGTYPGLAHPAVVEHLLGLGVTAVELMPVQQFFSERHLVERGLRNYWGYNPMALFAPHRGFAAGSEPVSEFKEMVRSLHAAGLEVILDIVLNHTAEGDQTGPTLSLRGLDNSIYYRLEPSDRARYVNFTGVGNTLDFGRPEVVDLAVHCLRYWVEEMHVDGFRFDLAVTLGRGSSGDFEPGAPFFRAVSSDPVLGRIKLIAEPWDLGPNGYQLGNFPPDWREWNDRFRDSIRRHCNGLTVDPAEIANRLSGSPDLFPSRPASTSINFVTSHDGFTLEDVVSYEHRRNQANGEGNLDGHGQNFSRNWGQDGPTDDAEIRSLRLRAKRAMIAALALADGVPMIGHGDELGRSQEGNNNAYCQDNEISWVDWSSSLGSRSLYRLLRLLLRRRRRDDP